MTAGFSRREMDKLNVPRLPCAAVIANNFARLDKPAVTHRHTTHDTKTKVSRLRRKTKRTYNSPGHAHFLTFSCVRRLPLLNDDQVRRWVLAAVENARRKYRFSVWAYVIMPEHVHLLVHPNEEIYSISKFLFACKRPVSGRVRRRLDRGLQRRPNPGLFVRKGDRMVFRFRQPGGGFDRNVTSSKLVPALAHYIHLNLLRRGLTASPETWPWSSAAYWQGLPGSPLTPDRFDP